jgi:hypothetical protein
MFVADAGPIIAFARIGQLDLLQQVAGEIAVPDAVYEELVVKGRGRAGAKEIEESPWIRRHALENPAVVADRPASLHLGEWEAIALAQHLGAQLLIDEQRGREVAQAHGVEVLGSLAVLAEAKRRGIIDFARPLLSAMITSGYWMDADLVMAFLAEVGEGEDTT